MGCTDLEEDGPGSFDAFLFYFRSVWSERREGKKEVAYYHFPWGALECETIFDVLFNGRCSGLVGSRGVEKTHPFFFKIPPSFIKG